MTAPNVLIWSAVSASCAIPNVYAPVQLMCKKENGKIVPLLPTANHKYIDGSVDADVPMQRLSELFNCNYFIVSQVNPYVIPFLNDKGGGFIPIHERVYQMGKSVVGNEVVHWLNQFATLGIVPSKLKRFSNIVTQDYYGHVTIFPKPSVKDLPNVIKNPTPDFVERGIEISE